VKEYLKNRLEEYDGVLFTEDTKQDAKKAVASLRKEKKELIDRVKEVKEEYMKNFNEFYGMAVELIDMYDKPINFINEQIEDYEKKRIEEKKVFIKQLYDEYIGCDEPIAEYIPLAKIYNPKWENATTNRKAICSEMMEYKEKVKQAITAITEMHSDVEETALQMFRETYDLTRCILFINNHEKQKAEILAREQERIRREEEERIRREEREKIEAERRAQEEKEALIQEAQEEIQKAKEETAKEVIEAFTPNVEGMANLYEYRISLTDDAKAKLEMYMDSVGIEWEEM
jgi:DNA repair exonuclease SbcCD ATPase subunit